MKTPISAILPLLLISLACMLAVESFYKLMDNLLFMDAGKGKVVARIPEKKQATAATKRTLADDVRVVLERNLFGPPPSAVETEQAAELKTEDLKVTSLDLVLMGTIICGNEENRAIILEKAKKKQDIYEKGELVQGAVLKEIMRGKVVLNHNNQDEILDMTEAAKYSGKPSGVAAAANASAAANSMRQVQTLPGPEAEVPSPEQPEPEVNAEAQDADNTQENPEQPPEPREQPAEETVSQNEQVGGEPPLEQEVAQPVEIQPAPIRPARRFTIQLPAQPSE